MRDMLDKLQQISEEQEDFDPEFFGPESDIDNGTLSHEAVEFEEFPTIDDILNEAHSIRKDISLLHLEVERLRVHNQRYGTTVRRLSLLKKDSDSIARDIQQHGESLFSRLQALGRESDQLEEEEGPSAAVSRIARVQYDTLTRAFHEAMNDYHMAEEAQKSACRQRIQRQASIWGTQITDDQLDVLVNKGGEGWTELSQKIQPHSSRWALCEIKGRHKELVELEARMKEVHELFLDMAMLVEDQGCLLNNIEAQVCGTQEYIEKFNMNIKKAIQYKRKNPFLQCCPCLPCWRHNQTL
ncbi:syntaxin-11-like [Salarias fasciatus]|uniref:Syntaxin-11-like n=1 Tax=Salarias fasciatus TaxID=181472 RepID=A0A672HWZ7_SALFA|nr:syntaxin-11-like [Salarias fasciatus]